MPVSAYPHTGNVRGVFLDFDGTLFSTERIHRLAIAHTLQEELGVDIDPDELRAYSGLLYPERLGHALAMRGIDDEDRIAELSKKAYRYFQQHVDEHDTLLPGAKTFISAVADANIALAIVSSGFRSFIENELDRVNLRKFFSCIIACEDVPARKPHPAPYRAALDQLNLSPHEVVAFEDSPPGIESARLAGITVVALLTTFPAQDLEHAIQIIRNFNEISIAQLHQLV
ncbi:MAG: HAD family phosphatase [Candidatus Kerfeldbacteria bacterium]|nr:HAD family phosphatase [Candidatus Kerfeldbacteria bacterium]